MPTVESVRPIAAPRSVLAGLAPVTPPIVAKARMYRAKYSAGPKLIANCTSSGANSIRPMVEAMAPTKEAMPEIASASGALPFLAIG